MTHLMQHLYLSPIPVVLMPCYFIFLLYFSFTKNNLAEKFVLKAFIFSTLFLIPIYISGSKSVDPIEDFPGVNQSGLELHNMHSHWVIWTTVLAVLLALACLFFYSKKIKKLLSVFLGLLLFINSIEVFIIMNSGLKIRHTEIRDTNQNFGQHTDNK